MASNVLTYSPSDVKIILCGYVLTGIVSVTLKWKGTKPIRVVRGLNGQHTRVLNNDIQATVELEVLQTSITNDILSSIIAQDRRTQSARLEFSVSDTRGTTMYQSTDAFIGGWPEIGLSGELQTRKWEVECLSFIDGVVGGNARQGFDVFDSVSGALGYLGEAASDVFT
ncbi:virion structural protein [Pseudomonas phage vB_PpuM-NoPa]|uniref:Virion structural protein n=4 Tax=Tartuvirus TaxID=3424912 RepID=A0AAX4MWP7_9CAUD